MLRNWLKTVGGAIATLWLFITAIAPTEGKDKISTISPISYIVDFVFYMTIVFAILVLAYIVIISMKNRLKDNIRLQKITRWIRHKLRREPEYDFKRFDELLDTLEQVKEPNTKARILADFQNKLRSLCDVGWNDKVKNRIERVLKCIPEKLSDSSHFDSYLFFLKIISGYYPQTINMVKEKFLRELENMYNNPRFETNAMILGILQSLHEYSEDHMMKLSDDAGYRWSDQRFAALGYDIEFWTLKARNEEAHQRVLKYLLRKMEDAERDKDEKSHRRFEKLYNLAERC